LGTIIDNNKKTNFLRAFAMDTVHTLSKGSLP
jgi:hypothetical protein